MRAVNLLPSEGTNGRGLPGIAVVAAAAAPIVGAALVFAGYALEHSKVVDKRGQLASLSGQVSRLPKVKHAPVATGNSLLTEEAATRLTALDAALADRMPWDTMLNELAEVVPSDVWLTSLALVSPLAPGSTSSSGTDGFTVAGSTTSQDAVAHLLQRLSLLPAISNVTLTSVSGQASGTPASGPSLVTFQVTATIDPPPSPSSPSQTPAAGTTPGSTSTSTSTGA